ncbi:MAG: helix-turn-helix domain-containing protein [Planctomycetes bacterium]|nr:helix-turn-helix domain-containing protein [Planctomycetota bacterium]
MTEEKQKLMGLQRGLGLIKLLSAKPNGCSFNEIQSIIDLPSPTLSRLLKALVQAEYAVKNPDTGRYEVGDEAVVLARSILGSIPRENILKPVLEMLAKRTGESGAYFEIDGDDVVIRAKMEHAESFHYMPLFGRNRVFAHGFLQVIVAFLPEEEQNRFLPKVAEMGLSQKEWRKRMAAAKENYYYIDDGESNNSTMRITSPVFSGNDGKVIGSIGLTILQGGITEAKKNYCIEVVTNSGRQASNLLREYSASKD